ncbi:MAG: hypothetical protein WCT19_01525 [Candidatus Paceibacterota bacterium]
MSQIKMTGKMLYLRYSFPCAKGRCDRKEITPDDLEELTRLVKNGEEPIESFLNHCFPLSFGPFTLCSEKKYPGNKWSVESVRYFWRNEHGRNGDERVNLCHTEKAIVVREFLCDLKEGGILVSLAFPGSHNSFPGINFYGLDLKKGDEVELHQKWVVEKS